jgi:acyl-coenzyme A thioesterase PaaI-like protein
MTCTSRGPTWSPQESHTRTRRLTVTGRTIHVGRSTATAEGRVDYEDGWLVAHATTTCIILRP